MIPARGADANRLESSSFVSADLQAQPCDELCQSDASRLLLCCLGIDAGFKFLGVSALRIPKASFRLLSFDRHIAIAVRAIQSYAI